MARNSQTAQTQDNPEQCPTPSQPRQARPVSLVGPPAEVQQWGPTPDMVIGHVEPSRAMEPDPTPVVTFGDDKSITIN
jgi:hypothetical protein